MKTGLTAALALLFLTTCREKPTALPEPLFLTFFSTSASSFCEPDSGTVSTENRGSLVLLTNNKALYALKSSDTIRYYRGTYRLIDNGIFCNFDAEYDHARAKAPKPKKVLSRPTALRPVKAWNLHMSKTGCGEYIYYSEKGNLEKTEDSLKLLYSEADPSKAIEYITRINGIPALVDFHMEVPPAVKTAMFAGQEITAPIEDYYVKQNQKGKMTRREDDSVVQLSFSYRRQPKGEDPGPYLFVTIPKSRQAMLSGDVSGDGQPDLVVQPVLSQGGGSKWQEMFVFVRTNEGFRLRASASNFDLAQYKGDSHSGCFYAKGIRDGKIEGTSLCYRDEDPQCCPSVKVPTRVVLKDETIQSFVAR